MAKSLLIRSGGLVALLLTTCATPTVAEITLFDWAINQDGSISVPGDPLPPGSAFDPGTGLGTIQLTFTGLGRHSGLLFVDHELSEALNTFWNEVGESVGGVAPAGLTWEIDEPGFFFGDIYDNLLLGSLDNSALTVLPEDISMALGWGFDLLDDEIGVVRFLLSETPPAGFHLRHSDPDSGENVYFSSELTIGPVIIPEGGTAITAIALATLALVGTAFKARRRS